MTSTFAEAFARVEAAGLGITLHIAEVSGICFVLS